MSIQLKMNAQIYSIMMNMLQYFSRLGTLNNCVTTPSVACLFLISCCILLRYPHQNIYHSHRWSQPMIHKNWWRSVASSARLHIRFPDNNTNESSSVESRTIRFGTIWNNGQFKNLWRASQVHSSARLAQAALKSWQSVCTTRPKTQRARIFISTVQCR